MPKEVGGIGKLVSKAGNVSISETYHDTDVTRICVKLARFGGCCQLIQERSARLIAVSSIVECVSKGCKPCVLYDETYFPNMVAMT